jgi:uncharacterized protein YuzE
VPRPPAFRAKHHDTRHAQAEEERMIAPIRRIKVWYDPEGDFLEVLFSDAPGYMRETESDAIMERADQDGNLLGFSIMNVSHLPKDKPLVPELSGSR